MQAEKKVKSYTRRTKSGKTVTVKAHTAKYEAADKKDAAKKKGAGKELEDKKKTSIVEKSELEAPFTKDEFKEWYEGTGSTADKKVAKALRKQLGRSGYRKFEDEAIDNYTPRGHSKMFKRFSDELKGSSSKGTKHYPKEPAGVARKDVPVQEVLKKLKEERNRKTAEKNENKKLKMNEFHPLPKKFNYMGEQYIPTGKIRFHTEKDGDGDTYKVATCKAKSKRGNSITIGQYDKKGQKDFGGPIWDVDVTA